MKDEPSPFLKSERDVPNSYLYLSNPWYIWYLFYQDIGLFGLVRKVPPSCLGLISSLAVCVFHI